MASFTINGNFFLTTSNKLHEVFVNAYIAYVYSSLQSWTSKLHMHFKVYSQWTFLTTEQLFYMIHCDFVCVFNCFYVMWNVFILFYLCMYFVRNDEIKTVIYNILDSKCVLCLLVTSHKSCGIQLYKSGLGNTHYLTLVYQNIPLSQRNWHTKCKEYQTLL